MQADTIIAIVIGFLISLYFFRKSLRNKKPCWAIRSNNLVDGFSNKHEVETLTISRVIFWNDGAETINRTDLETTNRLRIIPEDNVVILDAKLLVRNNDSSQFVAQLEEKDNCAYINFDYLDEKQGGVLQVVHTGNSSLDVQIVGNIKGVKALRQVAPIPKWAGFLRRFRFQGRIYQNIFGGLAIILGAISILGSLAVSLLLFLHQPVRPTPPTLTGSLSSLFFGVILLYEGWLILRISNIAPKGLEVFDND